MSHDEKIQSTRLLEKFGQHLLLEKALSTNTLDAYVRDVEKLFCYLEPKGLHPLDVTLDVLENFLASLQDRKSVV